LGQAFEAHPAMKVFAPLGILAAKAPANTPQE
jgi:hypothetical protein